jgi:hypothetical protein
LLKREAPTVGAARASRSVGVFVEPFTSEQDEKGQREETAEILVQTGFSRSFEGIS